MENILSLSEKDVKKREVELLNLIKERKFDPIVWKEVDLGNGCVVFVGNDALKIGGIRINVSHKLAQEITDELGLIMITDKISDMIHQKAQEVITPCIQSDSVKNGTMHYTSNMIRHSQEIDKKVKDQTKLISTVGKLWIQHNRLKNDLGINYGWYDVGAPYKNSVGMKMWQTVGARHNMIHVDYSQVYRPLHPICFLEGKRKNLHDLYITTNICSYEILDSARHPQIVNDHFYIADLVC